MIFWDSVIEGNQLKGTWDFCVISNQYIQIILQNTKGWAWTVYFYLILNLCSKDAIHIVVSKQQQALSKHKCKHYIDVYAYII